MVRKSEEKRVVAYYPKHLDNPKFRAWVMLRPDALEKMFIEKGLSQQQIADKYSVSREEVSRVLKFLGTWSFKKKAGFIRREVINELPNECGVDNVSLGYLLGALLGDGSHTVGDRYAISSIDKDFIDAVGRHLVACGFKRNEFNVVRIGAGKMISPYDKDKEYDAKPFYKLTLYCCKLMILLYDFASDLNVLNESQRIEFVNGFTDAEGSVTKEGKAITIHNTDLSFLRFVSGVLTDFNVENSILKSAEGRLLRTGRMGLDVYRIYIGVKSLPFFKKTFRFSIRRKQKRLDRGLTEYLKRTKFDTYFKDVVKYRKEIEPFVDRIKDAERKVKGRTLIWAQHNLDKVILLQDRIEKGKKQSNV